jgi:hypothetical protein
VLGRRKFRQYLNSRFTDVDDSSDEQHEEQIWSVLPEWNSKFTHCAEFFEGVNRDKKQKKKKRRKPKAKETSENATVVSRFRQLRRNVRIAIRRAHPAMVADFESLLLGFDRQIVGGVESKAAVSEPLTWRGASTDCFAVLEERALKKQGSLSADLQDKLKTKDAGAGMLFVHCKDSFYRSIVHGLSRVYGFSSASFNTQHNERVIAICPRKNHASIADLKPMLSVYVFGEQQQQQQQCSLEQQPPSREAKRALMADSAQARLAALHSEASEIDGETPFVILRDKEETIVASGMENDATPYTLITEDESLSNHDNDVSPIEDFQVVLDVN